MKKALLISFFLLSILCSCTEEGPDINLDPPTAEVTDTSYIDANLPAPQPKKVLLEDFTGVRCPNCPNAQKKAVDAVDRTNQRVIIMALHPKTSFVPLTRPFAESTGDDHTSHYDFRTDAASLILASLKNPQGLPIGAINRKQISPGSDTRNFDVINWDIQIDSELVAPSPANIDIQNTYNESTREVSIRVKIHYLEEVNIAHHLSVAILESGMKDYQEYSTGAGTAIDPEYIHNHVLRSFISSNFGDPLTQKLEKGRVIIKTIKYKIPDGFKPENCSIVAFLNGDPATIKVFQSAEAKVK